MTAFDDSGLDPPQASSFVEADVTLDSGLDPPQFNAVSAPSGTMPPEGSGPGTGQAGASSSSAAGTATAQSRHAVTVRTAIQEPHPFSVRIESEGKVEILAVQVTIVDKGKRVFSTPLGDGSPMTLAAGQARVLPLTAEELKRAQPHLKVGNVVQVKLEYATAPQRSQLKIAIVAQK